MSRPVALDQALPLEIGHHPVDVDRRLSGDVGNLLLREGIVKRLIGTLIRLRTAVSHSRCATRAVESRRPQLTSHSYPIDFVALDQPPEELLELRISSTIWLRSSALADHDFARDDGLDAVAGKAFARQNTLAWKAQCDDLPSSGAVDLELAK